MDGQPEIIGQALGYAMQGWDLAKGWLLSPAAWSQFGLLVAAWLLAVCTSRSRNHSSGSVIVPGMRMWPLDSSQLPSGT